MQGELSVQFDDLFQKAWEEDVVLESEGDGMYDLHFVILFMNASVFVVMISWENKHEGSEQFLFILGL